MIDALFGIVAWLCWIHKQIRAQYPPTKSKEDELGTGLGNW
jgi:hypothetical protein